MDTAVLFRSALTRPYSTLVSKIFPVSLRENRRVTPRGESESSKQNTVLIQSQERYRSSQLPCPIFLVPEVDIGMHRMC